MNTSRPRHILAQSAAILLTLPGLGLAADWTGAISTDWNTGGNWTGGVVPAGQNAYIGISGSTTAAPFTATITANIPQLVDLQVARGGGPAILNHSAGQAMTGSGNWVDVGTQGGTGTYNLGDASTTGGTLTGIGLGSGSVFAGGNDGGDGRFYVGGVDFSNAGGNGVFKVNTTGLVKIDNDLTVGTGNGTGLMLVDAGTITTGGWNFIGKPDNGSGAANGTLKMSGGTLTNGGGRTYVGFGNSTGRIELSGTGTYNNIGDWFAVGADNLANATPASIDMTGGALNTSLLSVGGSPDNPGKGTLTVGGNSVLNVDGEFWIGNRGGSNGVMTVTGGTVSAGNWFAVGRDGATGVLTISGGLVQKTDTDGSLEITNANSPTANGTVNLDGGVLAVNNITGSGAAGSTANLFLNGGTLKPTVANADFISGNVNPQIKNAGALIDTSGFDIGIGKALVAAAGSTGGLTKSGSGTLTLGGVSTYVGPTSVTGGKLLINGSIATSSLTSVSAGGILGGTGTVGSLRLEGGALEPGASAGILNAGNTEFAGGTFRLELNGTATPGVDYDQLSIAGTFSLTSPTELAFLFGFSPTPGDAFTILSNDGADANVLSALFTFGGSPVIDDVPFGHNGGIAYSLDYNGGSNQNDLVVNVVPEPTAAISVIGGTCLLLGIGRRRRR